MNVNAATLQSYAAAAGLIGLAVYQLSTGDVVGAVTALVSAFGIHRAANSSGSSATS